VYLPQVAEDPPTMALPLDELRGTVAASADGDGCAVPAPVVPVRWQRGPASGLRPNDASLALFGLRVPPFVGRDHERSLLWAVLRDVSSRGRSRAAVIEAPSGLGATALASWLGERAHEVGAATVHVGGLPEGAAPAADRVTLLLLDGAGAAPVAEALLDRHAERPLLVVWTVREPCAEAEPLLDREGVVPVTLGPLPPAEQLALVQALLPLEPELAARVAAHTAASPRFAVQLLTDWVCRGWLGGQDERFGLRFELPRWPATLAALLRERVAGPLAAATPEERTALRVAAGREPATEEAPGEMLACAAPIVGRWLELGLAVRPPGGGFHFVDDAVREAVLGAAP
jgi:hypothetical protein